ncbi:hypothetical protein AVEN_81687-1 [Araneus ventricosus]|uniref:Histone-lysine N-methyltransferase SETMAR n=1 Tax=Araneus ventricosus TaxID=182803 RepID=A0A4Y2CKF1_ARAVE|nr:hypothetical protein AVEN_81687-1 [Araneus ventricosus]
MHFLIGRCANAHVYCETISLSCCHVAHNVTNVLRRWHWEVLEHPPYSPDLSPCDFHLFRVTLSPDVTSVLRAGGRSDCCHQQTIPGLRYPTASPLMAKGAKLSW